jgi:hypothetical protein
MYDDVERGLDEFKSGQNVRLFADLFVIAPFLIYMSTKNSVSKTDKAIFVGIALATIVYNTKNYIDLKKRNEEIGKA